ncbi:MAG: hypothetical protein R8M46_07485 [Ghiorsea sp.]
MFKLILLSSLILCLLSTADAKEIIELRQTACQFIEPEHGNHHYKANNYAACEAVNEQTSNKRLKKSEVLHLKPGKHLFRVHNLDVPYVLGFWLRGEGLGRLTLPSTSGGGIKKGQYKDYTITLKEGNYLYSCPLNPTPSYQLKVR